jgi:hypothetical protein
MDLFTAVEPAPALGHSLPRLNIIAKVAGRRPLPLV